MARPGARKFDLGGERALTPLGVLTLDGAWPGGWGQVLGGPNLRELSGIKLAGMQKKPDDSLPCRDTVSMLSGNEVIYGRTRCQSGGGDHSACDCR